MRLKNPGGIDNAIKTVNQVRSELQNGRAQGNDPAQRADAFLTWCDM